MVRDMRLLVVEDDPTIASFVAKGLRTRGSPWTRRRAAATALHLASSADYAAAVVDVMLPGMDGLALIEEMRRRRIHTPVHHPERAPERGRPRERPAGGR